MSKRILCAALTLALMVSLSAGLISAPASAAEGDVEVQQAPLKVVTLNPTSLTEGDYNTITPLGNGYIGAMVFGGVSVERLAMNDHSVWNGGPGANASYNGGFRTNVTAQANYNTLQTIRNNLQTYMNNNTTWNGSANYSPGSTINNAINGINGQKPNFGSYQMVGDVYFRDPDSVERMPAITRMYCAQQHPTNAGEQVGSLFDGSTSSKMYTDTFGYNENRPWIVEWDYEAQVTFTGYRIGSGNDVAGRDPSNWTFEARNDPNGEWVILDTQTRGSTQFASRSTLYTFNISGPANSYQYFRMVVTKTAGNTNMQMSEIQLVTGFSYTAPAFSNYRRELDLDQGIATLSYSSEGVNYNREYLVSYPDRLMAVHLKADQPGAINQFIEFRKSSPITTRSLTFEAEPDGSSGLLTWRGWPSDHNARAVNDTGFTNALHIAEQIKVIPIGGGTVTALSDGLLLEGAQEVLILIAIDTNYQLSQDTDYQYFDGKDPMLDVSSYIAAGVAKGYAGLYAAHEADYKELFDRVKLNLEDVPFVTAKSTKQLQDSYPNNNTIAENRYLEILYYQFGRYLLIASSRPGTLPANLQGIWAFTGAPWDSDYHANINLQMNYWPAEQANLSETAEALMEYIKGFVPRGTEGAQRYFGFKNDENNQSTGVPVRGWTIWHENNIWGSAGPASSSAYWAPEDGAWLATHMWEHYQFTKDEDFLRENYHILEGAALFWVDTLWVDTRDGSLVANPSYSPEHGAYAMGATENQAVVWEIFNEVLLAADILGYANKSEVLEIKAAQDQLWGGKNYPYKIGTRVGQFQEWKEEVLIDVTGERSSGTATAEGHRHTNHLFSLHPGNQIVAGRSAQEDLYVEAMKKTLNIRSDNATGWSRGWKLNFWARLRDGDHAMKVFTGLLQSSTLDNLFDTHSPFQIDGNFGGISGVTEMLLQSQGGTVDLLPALTGKWANGAVSGLKARGNIEVDMAWSNMQLDRAVIKPALSGPVTIKYPNLSTAAVTCDGAPVTVTVNASDSVTINAAAGKVYFIDAPAEWLFHDAYAPIAGVAADFMNGRMYKEYTLLNNAGSVNVSLQPPRIDNTVAGESIGFKNVVFGTEGANALTVNMGVNSATANTFDVRLDSPDGQLIARVGGNTGNRDTLRDFTVRLDNVTGTHDVYFIYNGNIRLESVVFSAVFFDDLKTTIAAFEALTESDWAPPLWAKAKVAYEAAVEALDDSDSTQIDLDAADEALRLAIDALEPPRLNLATGQAPSFVIRKNMIMQIKLDTNLNVTFTSSNSAIATVTQTGVLTGKSIGVAVVQIKDAATGYVINIVVNCTN